MGAGHNPWMTSITRVSLCAGLRRDAQHHAALRCDTDHNEQLPKLVNGFRLWSVQLQQDRQPQPSRDRDVAAGHSQTDGLIAIVVVDELGIAPPVNGHVQLTLGQLIRELGQQGGMEQPPREFTVRRDI